MDEGTCDDEVSVAKKTRTGNQSLGAAVLVRLKRKQSAAGENNMKFERRTAIHCDTNNDFTLGVKGQPFPLSPFLTHWLFPRAAAAVHDRKT